jgi:heptaprenyl diphosphate synthase
MRIGLANLPLMLALDILPLRACLLLALIKVLGQALVTGTLFSYVFLFSFAGSFASILAMFALRRFPGPERLSLAGIGVAGAMLSNGTQLALARFLVFGAGTRFLIPPFLAAGLLSGLALGLFCERFRSRSRWYSSRLRKAGPRPLPATSRPGNDPAREKDGPGAEGGKAPGFPLRLRFARFFRGKGLILAGLLMGTAFLLNPSLPFRTAQFLFFWLCALVSGRKQRPLLSLSVIAAVVLVNLLSPYGRVLAELGPLRITGGSLTAGLLKGISLEGLLMLSGALISCGAPDALYRPQPGHNGPRGAGRSGGEGIGGFGTLLAESFRLFGKIGEKKGRVKVKQLIEGIDALLLELEEEEAEHAGGPKTAAGEPDARVGESPAKRRGRLLLFLGTPPVIALTLLSLL